MATVTYIKEKKQYLGAMVAVMKYCAQDQKTMDELSERKLVSGVNCDGSNAITEFLATKAAYNKTDGINFYQYVQSFHPREKITPQQAHEIARPVQRYGLKKYCTSRPGSTILKTTTCWCQENS